MDLLDFSDCQLYFAEPLPLEAARLLNLAAHEYSKKGSGETRYKDKDSELALLRAHLLAPENLTVLVGLYRYYYFQHRLPEALQITERAMQIAGRQLGLPNDWQEMNEVSIGNAATSSFGLLRFYLLALKAAGIVLLRLGEIAASRARLCKLAALDQRDLLGAARLLEVVDQFQPHASPASSHLASALA